MIELVTSTLRLSTPLLFAAMGGLIAERTGTATICLEGVLINGAWTAAVLAYYTHNPWLGLLGAIMAGAITMSLHGVLTLYSKADHIISGVAINLLAAGITPFLNKILFGGTTHSGALSMEQRFQTLNVPLLSEIPLIGSLVFEHPALIYLALLLPFLVHFVFTRTVWGLRAKSAGDAPDALRTCGVSPQRVRWLALLIGGAIAGMGGAYLSISHSSQFTRDMTAGRGYIALTAVIFGKWKPVPTFFACLFFGFTDAVQIQLQSSTLFGLQVSVQFVQLIPYVVTLFVLVGFMGRAKAPLAIGKTLE